MNEHKIKNLQNKMQNNYHKQETNVKQISRDSKSIHDPEINLLIDKQKHRKSINPYFLEKVESIESESIQLNDIDEEHTENDINNNLNKFNNNIINQFDKK